MKRKITYTKNPKLRIHKYVVQITKNGRSGYWYCVTKKEIHERCKKAAKGSVIEVFVAKHKFLQAYYKGE